MTQVPFVVAANIEYDDFTRYLPIVFGVLLSLGFILLLTALGAPLIAAAGVLLTALSVVGAFGIARLIFQNGFMAGFLNFQPQGFVDAWAPLFFGAMVFGVAMNYTLFILSAAKESYETHADPERAMVGSVRTSGRVVVSAAIVMIAVFLTFALSGPLAPKEMGAILAVAAALDAAVVRLVFLPIVLRYGGHHSWHLPRWLGRVVGGFKRSAQQAHSVSPLVQGILKSCVVGHSSCLELVVGRLASILRGRCSWACIDATDRSCSRFFDVARGRFQGVTA